MSRATTHAVCLLGCEQMVADIQERCDKPTVAVVSKRAPTDPDLSGPPYRMCHGHAWMHTKDPAMTVTWLIPMEKV